MMASASSRAIVAHPPVYGLSGTRTPPGEPAGARWMCAAVIGSAFWTVIDQQTVSVPGLIHISATPVASGSPVTGNSFAPASDVVNGRPLAEADPTKASASVRLHVIEIASVRRRRFDVIVFSHFPRAGDGPGPH